MGHGIVIEFRINSILAKVNPISYVPLAPDRYSGTIDIFYCAIFNEYIVIIGLLFISCRNNKYSLTIKTAIHTPAYIMNITVIDMNILPGSVIVPSDKNTKALHLMNQLYWKYQGFQFPSNPG